MYLRLLLVIDPMSKRIGKFSSPFSDNSAHEQCVWIAIAAINGLVLAGINTKGLEPERGARIMHGDERARDTLDPPICYLWHRPRSGP